MKPLSYSILAAALACGLASAQTTAYTTPVGYVSLGNTAADNLPNDTDILVSIPLVQPTEWAGVVASVSGQTITMQGTPGWTEDQWVPVSGVPYVITGSSGDANGLTALIFSNDAGSLDVDPTSDISSLVATDTVVIRKATTLSNMLAGNTLPSGLEIQLQTGLDVGINLAFGRVYTYFGTWFDSSFGNAENVVIYPGESFLIRNTTGSSVPSLVVSGTVPTENARMSIVGQSGTQQDNPIGYTSPVGETLAEAGLVGAVGDELLIYDNTELGINKASSAVYTSFGTASWFDGSFNDVKDTLTIGGGVGFKYRRIADVGDYEVSDEQNYIPSL